MSSRYSSKVHQREGRTALFETSGGTPSAGSSRTGTPAPQIPQLDPDAALYERSSSPYNSEPRRDFNAAMLAQLESQNEDTVNTMSSKISALKDLTVKMGDQIKQSNLDLGDLGSDMSMTGGKIKANVKRMVIMAEKSGIPFKVWLGFFALVFVLFFWVWLF